VSVTKKKEKYRGSSNTDTHGPYNSSGN